jgi:methylglutaconyl-CoA hydratase
VAEDLVLFEVAGGVATITLNSPATRNALSLALVTALQRRLGAALADPAVRVIVLTGAGTAFCAGADLKESREANAAGGGTGMQERMAHALQTIWNAPKPVVARVNGHARAGGVGLMCACDIAVAAESAVFAFSEVRLGLIPAMISVVTLPKLPVARATELFLTGDTFDAARAVQLGLINAAVPAEALDETVTRYVRSLLQGGPEALAAAKRLVRDVPAMPSDEAFRAMAALSARFFASEEALEGMTAFAERRPPRWAPQG